MAGQLGLEKTPEEYVAKMVQVFREVRRVLRDDGTCWCNLGDSYSSKPCADGSDFKDGRTNRGSRHSGGLVAGLKPKDLVGIPWRVAFALQADGWYLRQDIIWHKPNPMPESVTDRCTKAHEYVFLLTKRARYWYDAEGIAEKSESDSGWARQRAKGFGTWDYCRTPERIAATGQDCRSSTLVDGTRNRRSVWTIPTQVCSEAHFATYPEALVIPCVKAGCPAQCCPVCGKGWERIVESKRVRTRPGLDSKSYDRTTGAVVDDGIEKPWRDRAEIGNRDPGRHVTVSETVGWRPTCKCGRTDSVPGVVFDPFTGSGTTCIAALQLGRRFVGTELNREYVRIAHRRISKACGLFAQAMVG